MDQQNDIFKKALSCLKDNTIITGGHFRIFFKENGLREEINEGTLKSFVYAVKLFIISREKNIISDLGILINDMGSSCDEEGCYLKSINFSRKDYKLPKSYQEVLNLNGIANYPIKIYWEKHIRNRGKKEFLRRVNRIKRIENSINFNDKDKKTYLIIKETSGFFIYDPDLYGKIILTRTIGKDKYGVPACPLIMAALSIEQSKFYSNSINFYYIGKDNIENIPNHFVIEKGKRVSELFGSKINVCNIYFE